MNKVFVNKQFVLQTRDFIKSWYIAAGVPLGTLLFQWITAWGNHQEFNPDWRSVIANAVIATVLFLVGRFFDDPKVVTTYNSNEKATQVADRIGCKIVPNENMGGLYDVVLLSGEHIYSGSYKDCELFIQSL